MDRKSCPSEKGERTTLADKGYSTAGATVKWTPARIPRRCFLKRPISNSLLRPLKLSLQWHQKLARHVYAQSSVIQSLK
jgi:hypothetical protein